jgi:hypothetical protein
MQLIADTISSTRLANPRDFETSLSSLYSAEGLRPTMSPWTRRWP